MFVCDSGDDTLTMPDALARRTGRSTYAACQNRGRGVKRGSPMKHLVSKRLRLTIFGVPVSLRLPYTSLDLTYHGIGRASCASDVVNDDRHCLTLLTGLISLPSNMLYQSSESLPFAPCCQFPSVIAAAK